MNNAFITVDNVLLKLFNKGEENYIGSYENLLNIFDYSKEHYDEPKLYSEQSYLTATTKMIDIVQDVFIEACEDKNIAYLNFITSCANIDVHMKSNILFKKCLDNDNHVVFQYMLNNMGFKMDKECLDYTNSTAMYENSICYNMVESFLLKEKLEIINQEKKVVLKVNKI